MDNTYVFIFMAAYYIIGIIVAALVAYDWTDFWLMCAFWTIILSVLLLLGNAAGFVN